MAGEVVANRSDMSNDEVILSWQKQLNELSESKDKTYYKDLDFKSLKEYYRKFVDYLNAMSRLLYVKCENRKEWEEIIKLRIITLKRIESLIDALTFDWLESTASFDGSSTQRQEAYETIVDELKNAVSEATPVTDVDKLETFMFTMKHFGKWLLSESIPFSLGERTQSTDPQRFSLEKQKVISEGGSKFLAQQQRSGVLGRIPFFRKKKGQQQQQPPMPEGEGYGGQ